MATPLDEHRILADDLRHYGVLRLCRLTLLLGTTGAMITAFASDSVRADPALLAVLVALRGIFLALSLGQG